eukprot:TRINITY_DN2969_c0_g1_i1.p1 TRINITY_DN2969_c0_g1~~TRINITY_DN2969_c0_g1_i1.p1  ORF type:complete len:277 (+),score=41.57 TRINITY_DN2969_c0_g1_i1:34-831(+)
MGYIKPGSEYPMHNPYVQQLYHPPPGYPHSNFKPETSGFNNPYSVGSSQPSTQYNLPQSASSPLPSKEWGRYPSNSLSHMERPIEQRDPTYMGMMPPALPDNGYGSRVPHGNSNVGVGGNPIIRRYSNSGPVLNGQQVMQPANITPALPPSPSAPPLTSPSNRVVLPMTGYLTKRGHFVTSWKKRWFVLSSGIMHYSAEQRGKELGSFAVKGSLVETTKEFNMPYLFKVVSPQKTFYLKATSATEVEDWLKACVAHGATCRINPR